MNLFNVISFTFLLYGALPITLETLWHTKNNEDIIITGQQCGCPCPQARLINGNLNIPDSIKNLYPNIYQNEFDLIGNSPLEEFNFDIYQSEIIIFGNITGVNKSICFDNKHDITPEFKVQDWILINYVPKFYIWNSFLFASYIILIPITLVINLFYITKQIFKSKKH